MADVQLITQAWQANVGGNMFAGTAGGLTRPARIPRLSDPLDTLSPHEEVRAASRPQPD